jgi:hypothetical protein
MKVRVLYPLAFESHVKKPPSAGDVVDVDEATAKALITEGYAEKSDAKGKVEKATAVPGEKREKK